jgi:hypothetical protein
MPGIRTSRQHPAAPGPLVPAAKPNAFYADDPIADYERRRNCVGSASARAPIVRFCARRTAAPTLIAAEECGVLSMASAASVQRKL